MGASADQALVAQKHPVPGDVLQIFPQDDAAASRKFARCGRAWRQNVNRGDAELRRTEPWGQTVTRLLTDDGLIVGISYAPSLHGEERA
jgi:hypothetical protein